MGLTRAGKDVTGKGHSDGILKVLYVHPSAAFGGASKSLVETYSAFASNSVEGAVLCPPGSAARAFTEAGMEHFEVNGLAQWDNTRYGHYRGTRWLILLRELYLLPQTWLALRKVLSNHRFDIVHLNEVTLLPWAHVIRRWANVPVVVHVRSLQRGTASDRRIRWFNRALAHDVDQVVAIDETVMRTLPRGIASSVIHNSLSVRASPPQQGRKTFRVAIVGVLLKLKGVYEFVEAARILAKDRKLNIEFWIVGENSRNLSRWQSKLLGAFNLAHDVRGDLERYIRDHQLEGNVCLKGFVRNVHDVYSAIDVLCFPSYLNAAGRPVFEAAYFAVPSIVAAQNPPPDTIVDEGTGLCISRPDSNLLANAIERLYKDRAELARLGRNAQQLADLHFNAEKNSEKLLLLYKNVVQAFFGVESKS